MAAEKRKAFAFKKADQAIDCFADGDWTAGLAKAQAALELLETAKDLRPEDTAVLCGGVCLALAACNRIGEALEFFCSHAVEIADERIKDHLLDCWIADANAFVPGDLVQLGVQLVAVVVGPAPTIGRWRVRVTGSANEASATAGPGEAVLEVPDATEAPGEELEADESDMTLLSLRLSNEQRTHWRDLRNEKPELFGTRMKKDNEARWQRLFGAAARVQGKNGGVGASANAAAQDLGLPLEQSFAATLHSLIMDCLEQHGDKKEQLTVDLLGCRPALELDDPQTALLAVLESAPSKLHQLTIRMCGPEVGCDDSATSHDATDNRKLIIEIKNGLYHDAYPQADADLVVAMNAGVGVPQYTSMWGPTLDLLAKRTNRGLVAITSYTAGELLREERLLRSRWAEQVSQDAEFEIASVLHGLDSVSESCTLSRPVKTWQRGDVALRDAKSGSLRISRCSDLVYVGPNKTPGRNRNFGKLVLWAGGGSKAGN